MIGTSRVAYVWVVFWATILNSVGKVSILYCVLATFVRWLPKYPLYWAIPETIFYILMSLHRKHLIQRPANHPLLTSKDERNALFDQCLDTTDDIEQYISKWFLDAPVSSIKRENVKEWLNWAFFNTDVADPSHDEEGERAPSKPDVVYGTVNPLRIVESFQFYRASVLQTLKILPPRPQAFVASRRSASNGLSYWLRPHTSKTALPVVFLHGIGVGLYPYMEFLKEVNQASHKHEDGDIGILAIEILSISSRLTSPMPSKAEMCRQLLQILDHHQFQKFILVTHSYGSVIATHLLKTDTLAPRISSIILIDPISILLNQPDVAFNFTVRKPRRANEWLVWYFGSKDIGVAHTLGRTFFWSENVIWKEDIHDHRCVVFLAENDSIINTSKVWGYLRSVSPTALTELDKQKAVGIIKHESEKEAESEAEYERGSLKAVRCPKLDHGQIFDLADWRERLKQEVIKESRQPFVGCH